MSIYDPLPIRSPFGGLEWVENGTNRKARPRIPIQLIHILYAYLATFFHNTQRGRTDDRQTKRPE